MIFCHKRDSIKPDKITIHGKNITFNITIFVQINTVVQFNNILFYFYLFIYVDQPKIINTIQNNFLS